MAVRVFFGVDTFFAGIFLENYDFFFSYVWTRLANHPHFPKVLGGEGRYWGSVLLLILQQNVTTYCWKFTLKVKTYTYTKDLLIMDEFDNLNALLCATEKLINKHPELDSEFQEIYSKELTNLRRKRLESKFVKST